MSDDHETKLRFRTVGIIPIHDDAHIAVEHVYDNSTCPEHGSLTDAGLVGIAIHDDTPGEKQSASILLDARDALLLADRIVRAAHLALELMEDLPDLDREVLRHSERQDG
jgi:hypothetical protein